MAAVQGERVASRDYRESLTAENQNRYDEKLKFTAGIDPYSVSASFYSESMDKWPEIEFPDIMNYLLFTTSRFYEGATKGFQKGPVVPTLRCWLGKEYLCWKG